MVTRYRVPLVMAALVACATAASAADPTCNVVANPSTADMYQTVTFAANAVDPDGTVVSVDWHFGDSEVASGQTVSHSYARGCDYTVCCTVTDDEGLSARCSTEVRIWSWYAVTTCHHFSDTGWHLISFPLAPDDRDAYVVFMGSGYDPGGRLYRYDAAGRRYVALLPGDPEGFGQLTTSQGYWLYVERPFNLCYAAHRREPWQFPVPLDIGAADSGWVLMATGMEVSISLRGDVYIVRNGYPVCFPVAVMSRLVSAPLYGWDARSHGYYRVSDPYWSGVLPDDRTTLDHWHGYWMHVEEQGLEVQVDAPLGIVTACLEGVPPGKMSCTLLLDPPFDGTVPPEPISVSLNDNGVGRLRYWPPEELRGEARAKERTHLARRARWQTGFSCSSIGFDAGPTHLLYLELGTLVAGDLNDDNRVDQADLDYLQAHWLTSDETADINRDGIVNEADLSLLTANLGKQGDSQY